MLSHIVPFDHVPEDDLRKRIAGLQSLMAQEGLDFALILQNVDRFYFSGTMQKGMVLIPLQGEPTIFVEKGTDRARQETPLPVTPVKGEKEIGRILKDRGITGGRAGLELDVLPVASFERLKKLVGFREAVDVSRHIREMRAVKSPFELTQIRESGRNLQKVFSKAGEVVREGVTELDIEAALVAEGRRLGHHGYLRMRGINQEIMIMVVQAGVTGTIPTFVDGPVPGAGFSPAVPQGSTFNKVVRGVPVTVDYCGGYNGYNTDETRIFVAGELDEVFRKPYETAHAIIEDAMAFGRAGIDSTELFLRARSIAEKAHLEEYFMGHGESQVSFIGHGIGLEINELPVITPRHRGLLKEGMVFAFEPKFVLPPYGAVGIEVDFIVRSDRLERVTDDSIDIVKV